MAWKPVYLIHGDDHGRIAERRASLRARAESLAGTGGVEVFEGDMATVDAVVAALNAMTFAMGRRFLVVDGVERFRDKDVDASLIPALKTMPPDTTLALFAREEGRSKVSAALVKAVKSAGGAVAKETALKAKELPRWAVDEAVRLGVELDGAAARHLVELVGERQQRLTRELEKLALEHGEGAHIGVDDVEAAAAPSAERQVWGLGDAIVARNRRAAIRAYLELRARGEPVARLVPLMARRLRDVEDVAARLAGGESPAEVKAAAKGSPWMIDRRIREARDADLDALRRAISELAGLERTSRGLDEADEDTAAIRAIGRMASAG